eukprot:gene5928-33502_t
MASSMLLNHAFPVISGCAQVLVVGVCRKISRRVSGWAELLVIGLSLPHRIRGKQTSRWGAHAFLTTILVARTIRLLSNVYKKRRRPRSKTAPDVHTENGSKQAGRRSNSKKKDATIVYPPLPPPLPFDTFLAMSTADLAVRYREWVDLARLTMAARNLNLPDNFDVDGLELCRQMIAAGIHSKFPTEKVEQEIEQNQLLPPGIKTLNTLPPLALVTTPQAAIVAISKALGSLEAILKMESKVRFSVDGVRSLPVCELRRTSTCSRRTSSSTSTASFSCLSHTFLDKLHVRIVCADAHTCQVLQQLPLMRRLCTSLVTYYPNRLKNLTLVDLPGSINFAAKSVISLLGRETREKIQQQPPALTQHHSPSTMTAQGTMASTHNIPATRQR